MKKCLVVPSIRGSCISDFLKCWTPYLEDTDLLDNLIVVEDNPEKTFDIGGVRHHFSWKEIDEDLGENAWIISRRDSAIRSYGFLIAHRLEADVIITLDDDCYPEEGEDILEHVVKMEHTPAWTEIIPGMRTRGIPYENTGFLKNVVANVGLWTKVPDYDSIQSLSRMKKPQFVTMNDQIRRVERDDFHPPKNIDRVLPVGQYFPLCGMNFAFKREVAVLAYFALMGKHSPYRRFDDIWFGIIFKKICDHLGLFITCGHPLIKHYRASDPFANLIKEAPGIKMNETFWETIDKIELTATSPNGCMLEVGNALSESKDTYLVLLGKAITVWTRYF